MKRLVNKLLFVIVIFTFLISAAGCSDDTKTNSNSSTSTQQSTSKTTSTEDTATDTSKSPIQLETVSVTKGIDGDTIGVTTKDGQYQKVRLIGVNTPESTTQHEQYGEDASNYTKSQLVGKIVYLEKDTGDKDTYNRLLRYVWIEPPTEITDTEIKNKMFNAILAYNGYAQQMTVQPNVKYAEYFKNFCADARNNSRGLWAININGTTKGDTIAQVDNSSAGSDVGASTSSTSTSSTSQTTINNESNTSQNSSGASSSISAGNGKIKGNINSKGEKIYHVPGGAYYDRTNAEEYFDTVEEAEAAGYRASKR